jgi:signal transduction histidine kinase
LARVVCAQTVADGAYSVTHWQREDGLPSETIIALAQTPDGFLWVATLQGLARFDGARFVTVREPKELDGQRVQRLFTDRAGALWVSTYAGALLRRTGDHFTVFDAASGWVNLTVQLFAEDRDGTVLMSTRQGGLFRFHQGHFERVLPDAPDNRNSTVLAADVWGDGTVWVRRESSVGFLRGTNFIEVRREGMVADRLGALAPRRGGGVWLFAGPKNLDVLGDGKWRAELRKYPPFMDPSCLLDDASGRLWFGTMRQGLVRTAANDLGTRYFPGTGFPMDAINCLLEDREGNIWVGGSSGGLARLTRWNFITLPTEAGLPATAPLCLAEDADGVLWASFAESGLYRLDRGRATGPMTFSGAEVRRSGWALHAGRDGTKWFGAYGVGLYAQRGGEVKLWTRQDGLPSNDIQAMSEGPDGALWIGCERGLVRFDGTNFVNVTDRDGWPRREVDALAADRAGNLWVGAIRGGVVRWRDNTGEVFGVEQGLPSDYVRALLADDDGSVWIGTTRGLAWWHSGRITPFDERHGLGNPDIHNIVDDQLGHLWLGTSRGVLRVARSELASVAEGKLARLTPRRFGREDGLPALQMSRGQPGALRARDGRIWFATLKGLAVVDPREVRANPVRPEVTFEEVLIDSVAVPHASAAQSTTNAQRRGDEALLRIPAGARRLEFHYTTPMLTMPERVRFQRRLAGIDDDWRDAGAERVAVYQGLRPGHYRLNVRAANDDGVWSSTTASLGFFVAPVWWETTWFRVVGAAGFAGLLGGIFWLRLRVMDRRRVAQQNFSRQLMAQQEAERQRIAAELHDSLGQSLSIIQNRAVMAAGETTSNSTAAAHISGISQAATEALSGVREICQGLRPVELDRLGLSKTIQSVAERLSTGTALKVTAEIDPVDKLLPKDDWIHVLRFVQEALNNVVKHARATEAAVTLREDESCLHLVVRDNGAGFDSRTISHASLGLTTMHERARILGAELNIESAPGNGTTVRLDIPFGLGPSER